MRKTKDAALVSEPEDPWIEDACRFSDAPRQVARRGPALPGARGRSSTMIIPSIHKVCQAGHRHSEAELAEAAAREAPARGLLQLPASRSCSCFSRHGQGPRRADLEVLRRRPDPPPFSVACPFGWSPEIPRSWLQTADLHGLGSVGSPLCGTGYAAPRLRPRSPPPARGGLQGLPGSHPATRTT